MVLTISGKSADSVINQSLDSKVECEVGTQFSSL